MMTAVTSKKIEVSEILSNIKHRINEVLTRDLGSKEAMFIMSVSNCAFFLFGCYIASRL